MRRIAVPLLLALVPTLAAATSTVRGYPANPGIAQPPTTRLDAAIFSVRVRGEQVGREQISVHRASAADGVALELRSESAIGDRRIALRIDAEAVGAPVRYALEERSGTEITLRIIGQRQRTRFATQTRAGGTEAAREFLATTGTVILDDDGLAQYALLLQGQHSVPTGSRRTIRTIAPRADRQGSVQLTRAADSDTVTIDGLIRPAIRWELVTDRQETRWLWSDSMGRLLRVSIPARQLDARRDEFPRSP
jgi:hypothetical protein